MSLNKNEWKNSTKKNTKGKGVIKKIFLSILILAVLYIVVCFGAIFYDNIMKERRPYTIDSTFRNDSAYATSKNTGLKGIVNKKGKELIPFIYDEINYVPFYEGDYLVRVRRNNLYGFVDRRGNEVVRCQFSNAHNFNEGRVGACKDGKCGFINESGDIVIPFVYDEIISGYFYGGVTSVTKNGENFYITKNNRRISWAEGQRLKKEAKRDYNEDRYR